MGKTITPNQFLGEIGENAVRGRFLALGFQFDGRSRLEVGIDGIAEVVADGEPQAKMIAVQVKATESGRYASETEQGFTYLLRRDDLEYWRASNLPVIIVLYRRSDESFYWKEVQRGGDRAERRLQFDKEADALDGSSVNRLAALTVPKAGLGYYVPPLGGGEEAIVNMLPITLPSEIFTATTPYDGQRATAIILNSDEPARFDWIIRGGVFWSFHDPSQSSCREIVDLDQIVAVDTEDLAFHDDLDEQNKFIHLLRQTLRHQTRADLNWSKDGEYLYFRAEQADTPRTLWYHSAKNKTDADVVAVTRSDRDGGRVSFVRHHAFVPRFERLAGQWYLVITPTYHFTTNGFSPHPHPAALLSGKKRLDKSAALRGQVIMWHRFLAGEDEGSRNHVAGLFAEPVSASEPRLHFGAPPTVQLEVRVPEDSWGTAKKKAEPAEQQGGLFT